MTFETKPLFDVFRYCHRYESCVNRGITLFPAVVVTQWKMTSSALVYVTHVENMYWQLMEYKVTHRLFGYFSYYLLLSKVEVGITSIILNTYYEQARYFNLIFLLILAKERAFLIETQRWEKQHHFSSKNLYKKSLGYFSILQFFFRKLKLTCTKFFFEVFYSVKSKSIIFVSILS